LKLIEAQDQRSWVTFTADFHRSSPSSHCVVGEEMVGLRFVIQDIGLMTICLRSHWGVALQEAKILAFGVLEASRRLGIGRSLQIEAIRQARARWYQLRSHSSGSHSANRQLKLAMGFGVHPIRRGDDNTGAYFILPLRAGCLD
jgi:ribosomal protein S18 acetylase RimI-like enzyme